MSNKSTLTTNQPGFFRDIWQQAKLVFQLILDPSVPIYLKALPFAAVAYLLFPFDFLPDVIPGLGQLDDITILLVGAKMFIDLAPQDVVAKYLDRLREGDQSGEAIDQTIENDADHQGEDDIIEGIIIDDGGKKES